MFVTTSTTLTRDFRKFSPMGEEEKLDVEENVRFISTFLKYRRFSIAGTSSSYLLLRFFISTSNIFKRFISEAGYALNNLRQSISLTSFES